MQKDDFIRIQHMLEAAREVVAFAEGRSRADLATDRMLSLAIVRCIEIVGEAASNVSAEGQDRYPQIPWRDIVGMRNRVVHAYFDVDLKLVWDTITEDLPPLIVQLDKILATESNDG